jgi:hypothetical protein
VTREQLIEWAREQMERTIRETTPAERFQWLVDAGVIDKEGNVLLRADGPEVEDGQDGQQDKKAAS